MPQSKSSPAVFIPDIQQTSNDPSKATLQKRKRVTRACDECRKKKVKCDGQQPCIHCTVYSYDCTYDQPSNRKKNGADVHLIETKLRSAEHVLHLLLPDLDVFDPNFNYEVFEEIFSKFRKPDGSIKLDELSKEYKSKNIINTSTTKDIAETPTSNVSTPTASTGLSALPSNNTAASNTSNNNNNANFTNNKNKKRKLTFPHANIDGSIESRAGREIKIILPPKNIALELVTKTWASPCVLFRFYHRPAFIADLDELYETDPENYTNKQNKFLPLAYSVMAVGALFSKRNGVDDSFLDDEGYRYFIAARKLIDITDARDLYAIQTIVMLILFLQCSARLSTCYSYIGVALRSALKEGLHRKLAHPFNPVELEIRKRIFWTIYKMDIYVNTMLGLPRSIATEDIDQDLPEELDDDKITEDGYLPQDPGKLSSSAIANSHTKLILVLNQIVKNLYPINSNLRLISHEKVSQMELELRSWLSNLPKELIPGFDPPFQYYKANRLLHLSFLHVQIVLYRPFIHYISPKYTNQPNVDSLSIQRAKNCISVARTVVNLAQDMIKKNMLSGSYWFSIYTIFFSVACLVYYVHEVPFDEFHPDYIGIRSDAEAGKEILTLLKDSSMAASRTYNILNSLFEQLNRKTAYLHAQRQQQRQREEQLSQQSASQTQQQQQQQSSQQLPQPQIPQSQQSNILSNNYSVPIAQNLTASNVNNNTNNFSYPNQQSQPSQQNIQPSVTPYDIKIEESLDDFDYLANFDNFINPNSQFSQPANQISATKNTTTNNTTTQSTQSLPTSTNKPIDDLNNNSTSDNSTNITGQTPAIVPTEPGDNYMPGMIDQLDMQIFGRFLPPYMLKRPDGTTGPGAKGGDLPSGLNTTNNPTKLEDLPNLNNESSNFTNTATTTNGLGNAFEGSIWNELNDGDFTKFV
ncbi:putative transcriptional activator [Wickerhamomyces ciferrii]|uniref:Transcriptional activator n=1 Tax=Wickerhamomyces ciferrii (strain ATCC 14091 / BCRC 22168 / CBS 111 / JCM 3599 / NBRC 0793 / NRRL Y-1031 F-60-10) TaxID=1206466 RepID=K0KIY7_WICCF|nr:putative transcriptional activator [Wickerhamomyces ciferrii]CCH41093.1 putative transcriptional activator [Wickerhamomyces ciferrii]